MPDPGGLQALLADTPVRSADGNELISWWDWFEVAISARGEEGGEEGLLIVRGPGVYEGGWGGVDVVRGWGGGGVLVGEFGDGDGHFGG